MLKQVVVWLAGVAEQGFPLQQLVGVEVHVSSVVRQDTGPVNVLEARLLTYRANAMSAALIVSCLGDTRLRSTELQVLC